MYDVILKNGLIMDGKGGKGYKADIAVFSSTIALITNSDISRGKKVIDCSGKIVAPGFIDSHTHSDFLLLSDPSASYRVGQGITTDISGNCGIGVFPYKNPVLKDYVKDVLGEWKDWKWNDFTTYKEYLMRKGIGCNEAFLVSHTALRAYVMGSDSLREAKDEEIEAMCSLLSDELDKGAIGFSSGLYYAPCVFASRNEILSLLNVVASKNKVFSVHHRSEGRGCVESLIEVLDLAKESGVRLEVSHLKAIGKENEKNIDVMLDLVERYRREGVDVKFDVYPYTFGSTSLFSLLPPRVLAYSRLEQRMALSLESERRVIKDEIMNPDGWDSVYPMVGPEAIKALYLSTHPEYNGMTLSEIAGIKELKDPLDALFDILGDETGLAVMTDVTETEESLEKIMSHPLMCFGTDSLYSSPLPHPRSFHSTVHFLKKYVLERKLFTMEEAIRRMTGETAERFGLKDRGVIEEGKAADITVFDPERLGEVDERRNRGFSLVLVNGKIALKDDIVTGETGGKVLTL